ncbi:MAG: hypothetical protein Fur0028_09590 [Bacteroidales bacterium]
MINNNKINAKITGWFFIIAAISSIIGLKLYDPILNNNNFLQSSNHYSQIVFGSINELILISTAVGTGIMLFPVLKNYNEKIALAYFSFRLLEAVFIMIGIISVLTALSISTYYTNGVNINKENAESLMLAFIWLHKWSFMLGPNFMLAINTFLYSYAFYKTQVVPINLAKLGISASLLIMLAAILEMFGVIEQLSIWGILLALPIAFFEMAFAIRLINKGFNATIQL